MVSDNELRNRLDPLRVETPGTLAKTELLHGGYLALGRLLNDMLPEGRAKSIALTELESSLMWSEKAVKEWTGPTKE